ncbi:MAG: hypothetical protein M9894_35480, partial [Planctomycetes bacterium]|nr:hypothetical protein [Planctomycetota bacterium]
RALLMPAPGGRTRPRAPGAAFSADLRLVALGDSTLRLARLDGALVAVDQAAYGVGAVAFSPDGQHLAAGGHGNVLRVYRVPATR